MIYGWGKSMGSLFKDYVKQMWDLRHKCPGNPLPKLLLNCMWGALAQKNWVPEDPENLIDREVLRPDECKFVGPKDKPRAMVLDALGQYYLRPHARMAPFLTAWGRHELWKQCAPFADSVRRVHTDGLLADVDADTSGLKLGTNLGEWRLEGEGWYRIRHINSYKHCEQDVVAAATKIQIWYCVTVKGWWELEYDA